MDFYIKPGKREEFEVSSDEEIEEKVEEDNTELEEDWIVEEVLKKWKPKV